MNHLDDIHRRLRISNLQARYELHEIEAAALAREIAYPLTFAKRRQEANEGRNAVLDELSVIKVELEEMLRLFPSMNRK
jgi:hypothetical protein